MDAGNAFLGDMGGEISSRERESEESYQVALIAWFVYSRCGLNEATCTGELADKLSWF